MRRAAQVRLAEDDQIIEAFAPSRADEPLDVSVLPGRTRRDWMITDAHRTHAASVRWPERTVAVAEKMAGCFIPWKRFSHLTGDPLCRWIAGNNAATLALNGLSLISAPQARAQTAPLIRPALLPVPNVMN